MSDSPDKTGDLTVTNGDSANLELECNITRHNAANAEKSDSSQIKDVTEVADTQVESGKELCSNSSYHISDVLLNQSDTVVAESIQYTGDGAVILSEERTVIEQGQK